MKVTRKVFLGLMAAAALHPSAFAQSDYPARAITLVVPNPAGAGSDMYGRAFATALGKVLKQSIVVENLGGGGGAIGAQRVRRAAPDGYTLLLATTTDLLVTPVVNPAVGYAPRDFTPLAVMGTTPYVLVAKPALAAKTLQQVIAAAKAQPGHLTVAVAGAASTGAIAAVALGRAAGIELLSVPYKGAAPMISDVLGGQVDLAITTLPSVLPHVQGGKLVPIAMLSAARAAALPQLPTANEVTGTQGVSFSLWAGVAGPRGLPTAVVERLETAIQQVLRDPEFLAWRLKVGDTPVADSSSAAFAKLLVQEEAHYRNLSSGMKFE